MMNTKVSAGTIARTIILALALLNQLLSATGHGVLPIEEETIEELVSTVFTIAAAVVAYWKNNSFSSAAIQADNVMNDIRQGREPGGSKGVTIVDDEMSQKGVREDE